MIEGQESYVYATYVLSLMVLTIYYAWNQFQLRKLATILKQGDDR